MFLLRRSWYGYRLLRRLRSVSQSSLTYGLIESLLECWRRSSGGAGLRGESECIVVDIETSALDVSKGELLSIGWVVIKEGAVYLDTAEYHLVLPSQSVGQSAVIHQLRDCDFEQAQSPDLLLLRFLQVISGRVLVFHHGELDLAFLNALCRRYCQAPLLMPWVDTLALERKKLHRQGAVIKAGDLSLSKCRERYRLPAFQAHNALTDALATAELLLAQLAQKKNPA